MAPGTIWPLLPHGHSPTRSWAQPFPSRAAPRAKSCMVQGKACPVLFCPTGTACPIHLCPMSRACPGPPLSHGHSLLHPTAEHHLPGHSSALSPSVPWAQPAQCPLPGTKGTTCLMGTACCIPPTPGAQRPPWGQPQLRRAGCPWVRAQPPPGCPAPSGCPREGRCLRCRSGVPWGWGGLWGGRPRLGPQELHTRGIPATYMGRKRRDLGCGGR